MWIHTADKCKLKMSKTTCIPSCAILLKENACKTSALWNLHMSSVTPLRPACPHAYWLGESLPCNITARNTTLIARALNMRTQNTLKPAYSPKSSSRGCMRRLFGLWTYWMRPRVAVRRPSWTAVLTLTRLPLRRLRAPWHTVPSNTPTSRTIDPPITSKRHGATETGRLICIFRAINQWRGGLTSCSSRSRLLCGRLRKSIMLPIHLQLPLVAVLKA